MKLEIGPLTDNQFVCLIMGTIFFFGLIMALIAPEDKK